MPLRIGKDMSSCFFLRSHTLPFLQP